MSHTDRRITDLSTPTPEAIKYRNTQFLRDADHPYKTAMRDDFEHLRRQIWNVRNGDIRELFRGVPRRGAAPDRVRNVRQDSHRIRSEVGSVRLDTLYRRDRLHDRWYTFFTTVTLSADVE